MGLLSAEFWLGVSADVGWLTVGWGTLVLPNRALSSSRPAGASLLVEAWAQEQEWIHARHHLCHTRLAEAKGEASPDSRVENRPSLDRRIWCYIVNGVASAKEKRLKPFFASNLPHLKAIVKRKAVVYLSLILGSPANVDYLLPTWTELI